MSCPYFDPVQPLGAAGDSRFAMLPLGDSWTGICLADPHRPGPPGSAVMHSLCNLGYSRRSCSRFPPGDGPDAARFALSGDDGREVLIAWVLERDHRPFEHGALAFPLSGPSLDASGPAPPAVLRQAKAYLASYLRRKRAGMER